MLSSFLSLHKQMILSQCFYAVVLIQLKLHQIAYRIFFHLLIKYHNLCVYLEEIFGFRFVYLCFSEMWSKFESGHNFVYKR